MPGVVFSFAQYEGFFTALWLENLSTFDCGAARYKLRHFSTNLDEEFADPMQLNETFLKFSFHYGVRKL